MGKMKKVDLSSNDILSSFNEKNIDLDDCQMQILSESNVLETVYEKKFDLVNHNGKMESITITDPVLLSSIKKIQMTQAVDSKAKVIRAKELENLSVNVDFKEMGFENFHDLAFDLFDFKIPTVNTYIRVSKMFINSDYTLIPKIPFMAVNKLLELIPLVDISIKDGVTTYDYQILEDSFSNGKLKETMSNKDLRKNVKAINKNLIEGEVTKEESISEEQTNTDGAMSEDKPVTKQNTYEDELVVTLELFDKLVNSLDSLSTLTTDSRIVDNLNAFSDKIKSIKGAILSDAQNQ